MICRRRIGLKQISLTKYNSAASNVVSSAEGKNNVSCVKSRKELLKEKKSVTDHASDFLRRKYDVIVPPQISVLVSIRISKTC